MKIRFLTVPKVNLGLHICMLIMTAIIGSVAISLLCDLNTGYESLYISVFISVVLFVYYFCMLYHGLRYDSGHARWNWKGQSFDDLKIEAKDLNFDFGGWWVPDVGVEDNVLLAIIAIFISVAVTLLATVIIFILAYLGVNVLGYAFIFIGIPVYYLIRHGIRLALVNVAKAKGNVVCSLTLSAIHAFIAFLSVFVCVWVMKFILS